MFKNAFVIHRGGKPFFAKSYQGQPLEQSLVVGFSSSVSSFCKTLLSEEVREVVSTNSRTIYKEIGDYMFVLHTDLRVGSNVVQAVIRDCISMCELIFGANQSWDQDIFDLSGAQDIMDMFFAGSLHDPSIVVGGLSQVFLSPEISDRLDKLLGFMETQDGVCGNGTMLLLGNSVLHSRLSVPETRILLQYHKARSLGNASVRFTPVFLSGVWRNLYSIRVNSFTLVVVCFIDKSYSLIEKKVDEFQTTLVQSRLELPIEEPPVLIRLFAKRETLAMLYFNAKSGTTIFPALRPGPDVQQKEIISSFWGFFSDASSALRAPGVTEYSISKDSYRFFARTEGVHKLFIMLTGDTPSADVSQIAAEILKNVKTQSAQYI